MAPRMQAKSFADSNCPIDLSQAKPIALYLPPTTNLSYDSIYNALLATTVEDTYSINKPYTTEEAETWLTFESIAPTSMKTQKEAAEKRIYSP
jgi:hypothetical protein